MSTWASPAGGQFFETQTTFVCSEQCRAPREHCSVVQEVVAGTVRFVADYWYAVHLAVVHVPADVAVERAERRRPAGTIHRQVPWCIPFCHQTLLWCPTLARRPPCVFFVLYKTAYAAAHKVGWGQWSGTGSFVASTIVCGRYGLGRRRAADGCPCARTCRGAARTDGTDWQRGCDCTHRSTTTVFNRGWCISTAAL